MTTVSLTLLDCNDNPPEFTSDGRYVVTVAEGTMTNPIFTVSVNDRDLTPTFETVTYNIVGGTAQTNNWLDIDNLVRVVCIIIIMCT